MEEKLPVNRASDEIAEIYEKYFEDVYRFVYRKIPNRYVAEDIVQDVFLLALKKREKVLAHPNPKAWLMVAARYKIMELNKKMSRWEVEYLEDFPELTEPENRCGWIELELAALATVSVDEWKLLKEYHLYGSTISELAAEMGITKNNLSVRLSRLRKKLRESMESREG